MTFTRACNLITEEFSVIFDKCFSDSECHFSDVQAFLNAIRNEKKPSSSLQPSRLGSCQPIYDAYSDLGVHPSLIGQTSFLLSDVQLYMRAHLYRRVSNFLYKYKGSSDASACFHELALCKNQVEMIHLALSTQLQAFGDVGHLNPSKRVREADSSKSYELSLAGRVYDISDSKEVDRLAEKIKASHDLSLLVEFKDKLSSVPKILSGPLIDMLDESFINATLIKEDDMFPRCEYGHIFVDTSIWAMDDPKFWQTYHRSTRTRFCNKVGRKNVVITNHILSDPLSKRSALEAHTGAYKAPLTTDEYNNKLVQDRGIKPIMVNVRDILLIYKLDMCKAVVRSFERVGRQTHQNSQSFRLGKKGVTRKQRIVVVDNDYPCVLVFFSSMNPLVNPGKVASFWSVTNHLTIIQPMLAAAFAAYMNVAADDNNLPIEMVLRSSFGHNIPSVCQTGTCIRINIGMVPKAYAILLGETIDHFDSALKEATQADSCVAVNAAMDANVKMYNFFKLKEKISKMKKYSSLLGHPGYLNSSISSRYDYASLLDAFQKINRTRRGHEAGFSTFEPVTLKENMTVWEAISQKGNSANYLVLTECFRPNRGKGVSVWFVSQVMDALISQDKHPIDSALKKLLSSLIYYDEAVVRRDKTCQVTMSPLQLSPKRFFKKASFESIYKEDAAFSNVVSLLFESFGANNKPNYAMYAELDKLGVRFLQERKKSGTQADEGVSYGSDSEFEEESEYAGKKLKLYHKKVRVCSGMRAIIMAHHGILRHLKQHHKVYAYSQNVSSMYYEVEPILPCLKLVDQLNMKHVNPGEPVDLFYFDLNENNCAGENIDEDLEDKLDVYCPKIVLLDHTSTTIHKAKTGIELSLSMESTEAVILVDSGLKNNQGGLDFNPYGEIRIFAKKKNIMNKLYSAIRQGLAGSTVDSVEGPVEGDKLRSEQHDVVRLCKVRGLAPSFKGLFSGTERHKRISQEDLCQLGIRR